MNKILTIILAVLLFTAGIAGAQETISLLDWGFNIDGTTYCEYEMACTFRGEENLPDFIDTRNFDFSSGLGTIEIRVSGQGAHSVITFLYHDINVISDDEAGDAVGILHMGESWEIDEPGFGSLQNGSRGLPYTGDIFDNFLSGELDNRLFYDKNYDQTIIPLDEAAMTLGRDFELAAGETAAITFKVSTSTVLSGFFISQSDPGTAADVFFSSSIDVIALADCTDGDTRPCGSDTGECVAGTETCVEGAWDGNCIGEIGPMSEVCDNLDNDCDGSTDEDLTRGTTCGVGECSGNTGEETCTAGTWGGDTCDPLAGAVGEACDNLDNDCDGSADEDLTRGTTCGVGECSGNTGEETCTAGTWGGDTCDPLAGAVGEACDNLDNDCDGSADEDLTRGTTCGVGECSGNTGEETCTAGTWGGDTCDPLAEAVGEACDNLDNDCDGEVDEDLTRVTTCGVGECSGNTGTETCSAGQWGNDTCDPLAGAITEGPFGDGTCEDTLDNDCDGDADENDDDCNCEETGSLSITSGQTLSGNPVDLTSIVTANNAENLVYTVTKDPGCPEQTDDSIIIKGDTWKYDVENTGNTWMNTGYDDSGWASGSGIFGTEGNLTIGTPISNTNASMFFRKAFTVCDPSEVTALTLNALFDDGITVYINGTQVYSEGVTGDPPSYDVAADPQHEANDYEAKDLTSEIGINALRSLLMSGSNNVIAVGIYNTELPSSDIVFDGELVISHNARVAEDPGCPEQTDDSIISTQGAWKYDVENTGNTWMNTGYDDSGWASGSGIFGTEGNLTIGTPISNTNASMFFRKAFTVCDPSEVTALTLNALFDDGITVYINGTQVYSEGVTGDPPSYDVAADPQHEANDYEAKDLTSEIGINALRSLLMSGSNNVIAVGIYNTELPSSDIVFDGEVVIGHNATNILFSGNHAQAQAADTTGWTDGEQVLEVTGNDTTCGTAVSPATEKFIFIPKEMDCSDGVDDDGDGLTDCEDSDCDGATRPTTCGQGECSGNAGIETCSSGEWGNDTCDPLEGAVAETCDNVDNDCDGEIDEELTRATTCGVGACSENAGVETCSAGEWDNDTCDPFEGAVAETCDNVDNDCDGEVDEELTRASTCGVGACSENGGTETCSAGEWGNDTCDPFEGAVAETCDNVDNDCDGEVDEELTRPTTCGVGACSENAGVETCSAGEWDNDTCDPFEGAVTEGPPGDAICYDTVDNDCDGQIDECQTQDEIIVDFGASYGIWVRYDDGSWDMLHGLDPEIVTAGDVDGSGDDDLIFDFNVPGNDSLNGIWVRYDDGSWHHIHGLNAEAIAVGDVDSNGIDDLIMDFGASYGIWVRYDDGSWQMLHGLDPEIVTAGDVDGSGDDDLIFDFNVPGNDSLNGIWVRYDDGSWQHLHGLNAEAIVVGDVDGNGIDDLIMDFGASYGMWVRYDDGSWNNLHGLNPEIITAGDFDCNGNDDLIIDFGASYGIWVRYDDGSWNNLHGLDPQMITRGDIDGNGCDDLIADFNVPGNNSLNGIWVRYDNGTWQHLHGLNAEAVAVGDVD